MTDGSRFFSTLLLVFGFGSLAFAWFKYHREASLGLRVRSMLGAAKEPKSSGEVSGAVRDLRVFEVKEKIFFNYFRYNMCIKY